MTIDMHGHYFPLDTLDEVGDESIVQVEPRSKDTFRITAGSQVVEVEAPLFDLERQRSDLRSKGLSKRALMVPPFTMLYELPPAEGARWSAALNDGLSRGVQESPDDFIGFATIPLQDVDASLDELDRATSRLGLSGVQIATSVHGMGLDEPSLDPVWAKCEALGTPILVHPHYVSGADRMNGFHLRNLIGNPSETALAGARLIFSGVLERFPDLRIILSHGGGALPHLIGRLRHGFEVREECQARADDPIGSLRNLYYDTVVFDHAVLRHLVELVGASQVVLGTDYPFDMSEQDPLGFVRGSGLPASNIDAIINSGSRLLSAVRTTG